MTQKPLLYGFVILAVLAFVYLFSQQSDILGSAPSGVQATIATTTQLIVNTTASLVMATSSCSSRVISTTASAITIGFSDITGFVPSGISGHVQAASTTVAYDSGLYGCGAVRVYSFVSGLITVSSVQ